MRYGLFLSLALAGCTATGATRTQDPLDRVRFVSHPEDHHGFSGAGQTHAFVAGGDTLTLWAAGRPRSATNTVDSLALYVRPADEAFQTPVVIPLSALQGTERRWHPLGRWAETSALLFRVAGAVGGAALLADDSEAFTAREYLGFASGTAVGMMAGFALPYTYRRVSRCTVDP